MKLKSLFYAVVVIVIASVSTKAGPNPKYGLVQHVEESMSALWQKGDFYGQTAILKNFLDKNYLSQFRGTRAKPAKIRLENGAEIIFYEDEY